MKAFLFIESPLQLLNAYEVISEFKLKKYQIIIRLSGEKQNDIQIKNVVKYLKIKNIDYININVANRHLVDYLNLFISRFKYYFINTDKVFIGNYDSGFLKLILKQFKKNKIILLDDGSKTLTIQKQFTNTHFYDIFTMYNIEKIDKQTIYKNEYKSILKTTQNKIRDTQSILFLGTKLSEINIIGENYYLEVLKNISEYYKNKQIIYIPHRGESKTKLEIIEKYKNVSIKYLDYPVELYGLYEKEIPTTVASFYSTALLTMKNIYSIAADSFTFNYTSSEHAEAIEAVYEYYKNYMKVINLDD